ncbi:adenosylmethionine decarboxylase [Niveibacterium sp. SC-1]|uniref:adenosylmethionine decarboxylase n=1 Tax=Niveibacterium sp. SC-1 TaxID=3135646 RepID=UPI00311F141F
MEGLHILADLYRCAEDAPWRDPLALAAACAQAVAQAGLRQVGESWHGFGAEGGVTGTILLAESHMAIHTWPELQTVTLDVYVCNFGGDNSARAEALLAGLSALFRPADLRVQRVQRGALRPPVERTALEVSAQSRPWLTPQPGG